MEPGYDKQKLPRAQRPPDTASFAEGELAVVDEVLDRYRTWTSKQLVDLAHEFPGWKLARQGQDVPYRTVHISVEGPTDRDVARATELARDIPG
jgi:hypothetical protein